MRAVLRLLMIVAGLAFLLAGVLWFLLENPDRFKRQIAGVIESATGYQVRINGELTWRYWPPIAIQADTVELSAGGSSANFDRLEIDVDLLPLLTQQRIVDINRLSIRGGEINYVDAVEPASTGADTPADDTDDLPEPTVHQLSIEDVGVRATIDGQTYAGDVTSLATSRLGIGIPFDIALVADISQPVSASTNVTGKLVYQHERQRLRFDDMVTTWQQQDLPATRVTGKGEWRMDEQAIVVNSANIDISTLKLLLQGVIKTHPQSMVTGTLAVESADLETAMRDFNLEAEIPVQTLQFNGDVVATTSDVELRALDGKFDDSDFKGHIRYSDISSDLPTLDADIRINRLDLRGENPGATGQPPTVSPVATGDDVTLVPVELLRRLKLATIVRFDELHLPNYSFSNAKLELENDGNTTRTTTNANSMSGKLVITGTTNLGNSPATDLNISVDSLDIQQLVETQDLSGRITGNGQLGFEGTTLTQLSDTINGRSVFNISDGRLDVTPLKRMAQTIDVLRGKRSSISDWPDIVDFENMSGEHVFAGGFAAGQVLAAQVDNLQLTAHGGFNLQEETLDYDVTALFQQTENGAFKVSRQLAGIRWPLTCQGSFTDTPADLCLGRDGAIRRLVEDIAKQDLKRRGEEKIKDAIRDKVPEELQDLTEKLFKDLFK